jgi:D-alanyl-lipoteichoic acid acyltransferase DltB (MBOAT superfamily)
MVFTDTAFVFVFLPIVWVLYGALMRLHAGRGVVWLLAFASIAFYAYDNVGYVGVMLGSIGVNYLAGRLLSTERPLPVGRKAIAIAAVALNLALLGYFKYAAFAVDNVGAALGLDWSVRHILLPLGISFYTFTQIAYIVDCYTERNVDTRFGHYLLFVTFFPHLVAGPIIYHREMMPQFRQLGRRAIAWDDIESGLFLFMIGLAKKVLIADVLAGWVDPGYQSLATLGTADAWLLSLAYTLQLYFDFSGYSDMAIGLGLMFGIRLPINFDSPYRAATVREFWRRWHITLSRWLRRYVYIPLGGSKNGLAATLRNLVLTFLLGGIWHGAGWGYIVWGLLHGLGCCLDRACPGLERRTPRPVAVLATFIFVNVTLVFFRAPTLDAALTVLLAMVGDAQSGAALSYFAADAGLLVAAIAAGLAVCWFLPNSQTIALSSPRIGVSVKAVFCGAALALFLFMIRGTTPTPFLYFNF